MVVCEEGALNVVIAVLVLRPSPEAKHQGGKADDS